MPVQPHCGKAKLLDHLILRPLTDYPYFPLQVRYRNTIFLPTIIKYFLTFGETCYLIALLKTYIHIYTQLKSFTQIA